MVAGVIQASPCGDCDSDGRCTMNCGPARKITRAERAIDALRRPDPTLAKVPGTVRDAIAEVICNQRRALLVLNEMLTVPTAEYVPAIADAFLVLDEALEIDRAAIARATGKEG